MNSVSRSLQSFMAQVVLVLECDLAAGVRLQAARCDRRADEIATEELDDASAVAGVREMHEPRRPPTLGTALPAIQQGTLLRR